MRRNPFTLVYRWFLFLGLSIGFPLLSGCGTASPSDQVKSEGKQSPSETVKSVLMKANEGQYSQANQHLSPEIQKLREQQKMSTKTYWDTITRDGKIASVEILKEETRGEGARVKFKIHFQDDKAVESEAELLQENGKWQFQPGKTFTAFLDEPAKIKSARDQMKTLGKAVETYHVHQGEPPPSLETLLIKGPKGGPYLGNPRDLIDPWGTPYHYDPSGRRNVQLGIIKADIWSQGSGKIIGNWEEGN